jgi:hypothetical protein
MPLNFPDSPTVNAVHSEGGRNWTWNGTTWVLNVYTGVIPAGSVDTIGLANNAVTSLKLGPTGAVNGQALLANSSTATGLEWGQAGSPSDDASAILGTQVFS